MNGFVPYYIAIHLSRLTRKCDGSTSDNRTACTLPHYVTPDVTTCGSAAMRIIANFLILLVNLQLEIEEKKKYFALKLVPQIFY